jgi:hypothetical protein
MGTLSGVMDVLPEKLGALLEHEYALLSGVRVDVRFLQFELGSIRAAIHHYECLSENERNPEMRDWVILVRERAYDVDLSVLPPASGPSPASFTLSRRVSLT